jgi:putative nucleotidyltransferase with HDIG domain
MAPPEAAAATAPSRPLRVLVVDDDPHTVSRVHQVLHHLPGWSVRPEWVNGYPRARDIVAEARHDLYLVAARLPGGDGADLARLAGVLVPAAPVVLISARPLEAKGPVRAVVDRYHLEPRVLLEVLERHPPREAPPHHPSADAEVAALRAENDRLARELAEARLARERLDQQRTEFIRLVTRTMEIRGPYAAGHQQRIAQLAAAMARHLGLEQEAVEAVYLAGMLHDIGNLYLPPGLLAREGPLNEAERKLVRSHCRLGHDLLAGFDCSRPVADIVHQHHERLDGSGYPQGLTAPSIRYESRVLAVADVLGAMTADRPHRPAHTLHHAFAELARQRGRQLDADAVDACLRVCRERYRPDF